MKKEKKKAVRRWTKDRWTAGSGAGRPRRASSGNRKWELPAAAELPADAELPAAAE